MKVLKAIVLFFMLGAVGGTLAAEAPDFGTDPRTNNGEKWRIGYYEGGPFINYQSVLQETVRALMKLGWIEQENIPSQTGEQTRDLWAWLAENCDSEYIEFLPDAHYSANWNDDYRKRLAPRVLDRLKNDKDVDLIIAMGTWAGKDLANDEHATPTIVLSTSDPLRAGIINSIEDSGRDHVHATVDPHRYARQLTVFHEIIEFKKLGVAYEDSEDGRTYAAFDTIERMAGERSFSVESCYTQSDITDTGQAEQSLVECFEKLVTSVDAIYVTQQGGLTKRSKPKLVRLALKHNVPTFYQGGAGGVRDGFLFSLSHAGYRYVGDFNAKTLAKVFNGAKPNQIGQLFERPVKIAINLKTAELIGFDPPVVLLGAADEVFDDIPEAKK